MINVIYHYVIYYSNSKKVLQFDKFKKKWYNIPSDA